MDWRVALKDRFLDRMAPRTVRSRIFWQAAEGLARSPLNRPVWRADGVALSYFLRQTRDAYLGRGAVVWASLLFPSELIHAAGAVPFYPEMAAATASSVELAPRFLERAGECGFSGDACSFHRVILGSHAEGFLPEPLVACSTSYLCDSAPLSFQHVSLKEGIPHIVLEIPHQTSPAGLDLLEEQLEEAGSLIAGACGVPAAAYRRGLEEALDLSNRARLAVLEVEELRAAFPFLLDGRDALGHVSMLASAFGHPAGVEFYRKLAAEMRERVEGEGGERGPGGGPRRLLWMHLKPYYPNALFDCLEAHGARIVCEEFNRCYWEELDPGRPYRSLARKLTGHFGTGPAERRAERMTELARAYSVHGAVHFSHWGCRQSTGGAALVKEALRAEGVPVLLLESECIDGREYQEGQVSTRLEAFLESLR